MANLTLARWKRWPLNIGDNLTLPPDEQAYVEVKCGLTKLQLDELTKRLSSVPEENTVGYLEEALSGVLRLGGNVALVVDGVVVESLRGLLELVVAEAGLSLLVDLTGGVKHWNSVGGARELFTERLSGGASGMAPSRG